MIMRVIVCIRRAGEFYEQQLKKVFNDYRELVAVNRMHNEWFLAITNEQRSDSNTPHSLP